MAFDLGNVFFTGVSGGSLLLSGFSVPTFGAQDKTGVVLNCGALTPQVAMADSATLMTSMKIHFQSAEDEITLLQTATQKQSQRTKLSLLMPVYLQRRSE